MVYMSILYIKDIVRPQNFVWCNKCSAFRIIWLNVASAWNAQTLSIWFITYYHIVLWKHSLSNRCIQILYSIAAIEWKWVACRSHSHHFQNNAVLWPILSSQIEYAPSNVTIISVCILILSWLIHCCSAKWAPMA